ncbi:MAG: DUF6483 family protein [Trueperaceae bacterium]
MPIRDELIARTIQQIAAMLARLVTDRTQQEITTPEIAGAEQELDSLYLANLGTTRSLIHRLGTEDLLDVLRSAGTVHAERAYVLGALLSTEAAIVAAYAGAGSADAYHMRSSALDILLEAGAANLGEPDLQERVDQLVAHVPKTDWPVERWGRLLRYEAQRGEHSEAEDALFTWLENAGTAKQRLLVADAANDFYAELEKLEDEDLAKGGFSREEIGEGRADFAEHFAELFAGES